MSANLAASVRARLANLARARKEDIGEANSRMKDFFDLWVMASNSSFELALLADSIRATFARRGTFAACPVVCC